ncbi:DUF6933 domain-containing protein [Colwellia psychrerythraea]|uniref:DUF6933 domain-containing protein n=1 Tax=Colwellia psychrerythraea TaxID=28229 RepID=A0A099KDE1_COLPS|nr:hypothetical protein [Colwellia psychrerythraea]KGJ88391.1 hypothetical protein ND2E_4227 [Colwellia psychrerythraea]
MIIHCTKKLASKLPENTNKQNQQIAIGLLNEWQHWHANIITVQRKQCVIAVHDATRYAVFVPNMTKKHLAEFELHMQDVFINSLIKAGVDIALVDKAARYFTQYSQQLDTQFDTQCNRSVQGTMRLMAEELDWNLKHNGQHFDDIALYSTSAWLSDRPCNIKGQKECLWPIKAMTELLTKLPKIG